MSGPDSPDPPGSPDMDDLGPDLRSLLDAERAREWEHPMPDAARTRLRERLDVATGGALGGPHGGGGGPGRSTPGAGASAARAGGLALRRLLVGLSTFAVGAVTGAVGHALLAQRPQPVALQLLEPTPPPAAPARSVSIPVDPTPPVAGAPSDTEAAPPRALRPPPSAPPPPTVATAPPAPAEPAPTRDSDLAAERAIIDIAHTAIARGDSAGTLSALARHARQFPSGRMAEERESLYVQALVQAGRYPDARERAGRFVKHFPGSLFRPAVEAALAAIP